MKFSTLDTDFSAEEWPLITIRPKRPSGAFQRYIRPIAIAHSFAFTVAPEISSRT
jgi:hypothetical protein